MADTKITGMTAATALVRADLVAVVQDVATTPVNRKATLDVLDPGRTLGGDATEATSVAIHPNATASEADSVVIGDGASSARFSNVIIGAGATAESNVWDTVVIGAGATAESGSEDTVVIGKDASATGNSDATIVGFAATGGTDATVIGRGAKASSGTAVGRNADGTNIGVAVGEDATVTLNTFGVALGEGTTVATGHDNSVALGRGVTTTAADQVMVGAKDIEITGDVKGLVLEDRTLGTRHRVYLDDGVLEIEAA